MSEYEAQACSDGCVKEETYNGLDVQQYHSVKHAMVRFGRPRIIHRDRDRKARQTVEVHVCCDRF
jgi:hypothetical protein